MTNTIHPVLLCGGSGTRLWPLSRKSYPKQFVKLLSEESLFQASAKRVTGTGFAAPTLVTASDFRFIVVEQLAALEISPANILIEPKPKNTAAAICAAALALEARAPGALMLVVPSDHVIPDAEQFRASVRSAVSLALNDQIVTFGIRPNRAETGYGWLELSQEPKIGFSVEPQKLSKFIEKPDFETAENFFKSDLHLWNSGIFLFTTKTILGAFKTYAAETLNVTQAALDSAQTDLGFAKMDPEAWEKLPNISIDYSIMENVDNLMVVPYAGAWSDLGDWEAVWREGYADEAGMVVTGPATAFDCTNTLLHATNESQEIVGIGLNDIIAVAMPDAVLVAHKTRAQDVRKAVELLKSKQATQAESSTKDYRPWGWFDILALGDGYKVKQIYVKPGAALSLQSHKHRSEHWNVVKGTAKITVDEEVKLVTEGQSVYVPLGSKHRMENPYKMPMVLIEVQIGTYLGEDDIIRYEDIYARS